MNTEFYRVKARPHRTHTTANAHPRTLVWQQHAIRQRLTMTLSAARAVAVRNVSRKAPVQQQRRTIVDYLTNYPDKVREEKFGDANPKKTRM